jgi:2-polyprenyl-3-methyl-5-hydroxy-6-metoxy-1,4-benzoquinol methylase
MRRELLIGCGNSRDKRISYGQNREWSGLVTLDIDPACGADVMHDIAQPLPFEDNEFDEIHAYEVLEHVGQQGDWRFFFRQFSDFWRVLKPGGMLFASVPSLRSRWLWADPGHTRTVAAESLVFLSQAEYTRQVGSTPMTDYRAVYSADFETVASQESAETLQFILRALKPWPSPMTSNRY